LAGDAGCTKEAVTLQLRKARDEHAATSA
jgi:hypothetical protein